MHTLNILIADILPYVLDLVFVLAIIRFIFILGIVFALILANGVWPKPTWLNTNNSDRISPFNTTEVNFNKFLISFSKPFSLNKVY